MSLIPSLLSSSDLIIVRLYDEYYGLCMIYEKFSFFKRHIPGTYFHRELLHFEDIVNGFLRNVWVSIHLLLEPLFLNFRQKTTAPGDRSINWSIIFDAVCCLLLPTLAILISQ